MVVAAGLVHDCQQFAHHVAGAYGVITGLRFRTIVEYCFGGKRLLKLFFIHLIPWQTPDIVTLVFPSPFVRKPIQALIRLITACCTDPKR